MNETPPLETAAAASEAPVSLAERCVAVAISVLKPTDSTGLDVAIDYGKKLHGAVINMERLERGRAVGVMPAPHAPKKGPPRQISEDEFATLERLAGEGKGYGTISRATGLPPSTVRGIILRKGWRKPSPPSQADRSMVGAGNVTSDNGPAVALPPPAPESSAPPPASAPILAEAADRSRFRPLTAEELGTARPLWESGVEKATIAATFNVQESTISNAAQEHGWKRPQTVARAAMRGVPDEKLEATKRRYEAGDAVRAIADDLGVAGQTIYNLASKHGWTRPNKDVKPAQPSSRGAWAADKIKDFTKAWLDGDDIELIGKRFDLDPAKVSAAAAGLNILDDARRRDARRRRSEAGSAAAVRSPFAERASPPTRAPAAPAPVAPKYAQRAASVVGVTPDRPKPPKVLPDADPPRVIMLMDGSEVARALRAHGYDIARVGGSTIQWRFADSETVVGLTEMRRILAGLRQQKTAV